MSLKIRHTVTSDDPFSRAHKVDIVCVCVPARDEIDGAAAAAKRKTRNDSVLSQYINQTLTMFLISFQQSSARAQYTHTPGRRNRWACSMAKYLRTRLYAIFYIEKSF